MTLILPKKVMNFVSIIYSVGFDKRLKYCDVYVSI